MSTHNNYAHFTPLSLLFHCIAHDTAVEVGCIHFDFLHSFTQEEREGDF